jgi:hypothetical protein
MTSRTRQSALMPLEDSTIGWAESRRTRRLPTRSTERIPDRQQVPGSLGQPPTPAELLLWRRPAGERARAEVAGLSGVWLVGRGADDDVLVGEAGPSVRAPRPRLEHGTCRLDRAGVQHRRSHLPQKRSVREAAHQASRCRPCRPGGGVGGGSACPAAANHPGPGRPPCRPTPKVTASRPRSSRRWRRTPIPHAR